MPNEPVLFRDLASIDQFAQKLGIKLHTGPGAELEIEIEGKDEQHYLIKFKGQGEGVVVNGLVITPRVSIVMSAVRVTE